MPGAYTSYLHHFHSLYRPQIWRYLSSNVAISQNPKRDQRIRLKKRITCSNGLCRDVAQKNSDSIDIRLTIEPSLSCSPTQENPALAHEYR